MLGSIIVFSDVGVNVGSITIYSDVGVKVWYITWDLSLYTAMLE